MAQGHPKERDQEIPDVWTVYRVKCLWHSKDVRSSSGFLLLFLGLSRILTHGLIRKARSGRKKLIPDFMFPRGPGQTEGSNEQVLREVGDAPHSRLGHEFFLHATHSGPTKWYQLPALVQNFQACCLP